MASYFIVYPTRKRSKHSKKLMTAYAMLTNQGQSFRTDCDDLAIISQRWSLMQFSMQNGVKCVKFMWILHIYPEDASPHCRILAIWSMENWCCGTISPPSAKGHWFILSIIDYFTKWAEAVPLIEVKTINIINFLRHHVIHCSVFPGGSSMTMVFNLQTNRSTDFATSTEHRI